MATHNDRLLSARQLAAEAEISATTLLNWTKRPDSPLRGTTTTGGRVLYTWTQLNAFCAAHPELAAARRIAARFDPAASSPSAADPVDPEQMRAAVRNLRAAAAANLDAVLSAARHAERTASAHREQLEALATTIRGYDDLLTQLAAPITPHD